MGRFRGLVTRLLERMGACKSGQRKATLDEARYGRIGCNIELYILRTNRVPCDADVCESRFRAKRKRRRRALRKQPFIGCKSFFSPVPAPALDGMRISPKCLGQVVTDARRDERMPICNGDQRQRPCIGTLFVLLGYQSWARMRFVEIFDDRERLIDRVSVVNEGRNDTLGVDRGVTWLKLFAGEDVDRNFLESQAFELERHPHPEGCQRTPKTVDLNCHR